jgi:hypothetical protein
MIKSKFRFYIAAMGPGEIGQGMAFARYAISQGDRVFFSVPSREHLPLANIQSHNYTLEIIKDSQELKSTIKKNKPQALILCNSKIFTRHDNFMDSPPVPKIPSLSIDSNWLFSPSSPYVFIEWIDRYCLNLPKRVFLNGLKKYGGQYSIPEKNLKKIRVVGLVPSYKPLSKKEKETIRRKYKIADNEKLIFLYFSMSYMIKPEVVAKVYGAVKQLRDEGHKIKVVNFTNQPLDIIDNKDKDWFMFLPLTNSDNFSKTLGSSDLIFQHQGLATLEQAIGMNVPSIANVKDVNDEKHPKTHRHAWEVEPFARCGVCSMFYFHDSSKRVKQEIFKLLYNDRARGKMIKSQQALQSSGEPLIYQEAVKLIKNIKNKSV